MSISDGISVVSVVIAILAYRHSVRSADSTSRQIEKISDRHFKLAERVALNDVSKEYVAIVSEVNEELEEILKQLSSEAYLALQKIVESIDRYDSSDDQSKKLRHYFFNAVEQINSAYAYELANTSGIALKSRGFNREVQHSRLQPDITC